MIKRKADKVAIVGFASSWNQTPFALPESEMEIWGINELYKLAKNHPQARFDRWFEIHDPYSPSKNVPEHHNFLKNCKIPLYMQRHFEEFPSSIPYPRHEIKELFNKNFLCEKDIKGEDDPNKPVYLNGSPFTEYSNQISWMIALAIKEGFKEIHVYGVDMATKSEYAFQRSSCSFFIGYAAGKGIKILIPKASPMCKFGKDYGFETDNQNRHYKKNRKKELEGRIKVIQTEVKKNLEAAQLANNIVNNLNAQINQINGAISEISIDLENNII
jgi:hypothetical protein